MALPLPSVKYRGLDGCTLKGPVAAALNLGPGPSPDASAEQEAAISTRARRTSNTIPGTSQWNPFGNSMGGIPCFSLRRSDAVSKSFSKANSTLSVYPAEQHAKIPQRRMPFCQIVEPSQLRSIRCKYRFNCMFVRLSIPRNIPRVPQMKGHCFSREICQPTDSFRL